MVSPEYVIEIPPMLNPLLNQLNLNNVPHRTSYKRGNPHWHHYMVIGDSLKRSRASVSKLRGRSSSADEIFRVSVCAIPTAVLEIYLVDLLDTKCPDHFLALESDAMENGSIFSLPSILLIAILAAISAYLSPHLSLILGTALLAGWASFELLCRTFLNPRSDFSSILVREISRRRGTSNRTPKRNRARECQENYCLAH